MSTSLPPGSLGSSDSSSSINHLLDLDLDLDLELVPRDGVFTR